MTNAIFQPSMEMARQLAAAMAACVPALAEHDVDDDRLGLLVARYVPGEQVAEMAAHNGARPFYPASVVKLGWGLAAFAGLHAGAIEAHAELDRALSDMLGVSSNAATNYVVDCLTGTSGDTLLDAPALADTIGRRKAPNALLSAFGWPEWDHCQIVQKASDEDRYGRERQLKEALGHNVLTPQGAARLLHESVRGSDFTPQAVENMRAAIRRPVTADAIDAEPISQVRGFLGEGLAPALPDGSAVFSKAGWAMYTGESVSTWHRHDALLAEHADGSAHLFIAFTSGKPAARSVSLLPAIGTALAAHCLAPPGVETAQ